MDLFMLANGIERGEEFAFFFEDRAEALEAGGDMAATTWAWAGGQDACIQHACSASSRSMELSCLVSLGPIICITTGAA